MHSSVSGGCWGAEPSGWNAGTGSDFDWNAGTDFDIAPDAFQYIAAEALVAWANEDECCCLTSLTH